MNEKLNHLGIGEMWRPVGFAGGVPIMERDIQPGKGWCRADGALEAAWPPGAELCVLIKWFPDRNYHPGLVSPVASADHWHGRVHAARNGLRSIGIESVIAGEVRTPRTHTYAEILAYRLRNDAPAVRWPRDGWGALPKRSEADYAWYEKSPRREIQDHLESSDLRYLHLEATPSSSLWPPFARECHAVSFRPPGTRKNRQYWISQISRMMEFLTSAGYRVRQRERPISECDNGYTVLAYRQSEHRPSW